MAMGHKNERRKIQIEICNVFLCFGELFSTICICYFCGHFFFFFFFFFDWHVFLVWNFSIFGSGVFCQPCGYLRWDDQVSWIGPWIMFCDVLLMNHSGCDLLFFFLITLFLLQLYAVNRNCLICLTLHMLFLCSDFSLCLCYLWCRCWNTQSTLSSIMNK